MVVFADFDGSNERTLFTFAADGLNRGGGFCRIVGMTQRCRAEQQ